MGIQSISGSVAKNLAPLQNQKKPSQLGKLIIFIRKKIIHKGENYSVKLQKYNFCNGTENHLSPLRFQTFNRKYFEIGMKLNDFSIQLVKYCSSPHTPLFRQGSLQ